MGLLTQIVAAEDDEIEAIGCAAHPLDEWSGIEMRDIDIPKLVMLHCLLTGDVFDDAAELYEPLFVSDEGAVILRLDAAMTERLTLLPEENIDDFAQELAATEVFEQMDWDTESISAMLLSLVDLAQLAETQGQSLFAWLHPLRT